MLSIIPRPAVGEWSYTEKSALVYELWKMGDRDWIKVGYVTNERDARAIVKSMSPRKP